MAPIMETALNEPGSSDRVGSGNQGPSWDQSREQIRTIIIGMKKEEERLLADRLRVAKQNSSRVKTIVLLGNGLALAFLSASAFAIQHEMAKRSRVQAEHKQSEERLRLMISAVKDYAILMLDPEGFVVSWNAGGERIKGYRAEEIIGQHFSRFYPAEDVAAGKPAKMLEMAARDGRAEDEGWRLRKDGSSFWADAVITAVRDEKGRLRGFGKVTRDLTERRHAEEELRLRNAQLEAANKELESFSYSVSHDLRAPLRAIDGFSLAILEDYEARLDADGKSLLERIRAAVSRMGRLIDDMLNLARIARSEMVRDRVNLSKLAEEVVSDLCAAAPERLVSVSIAPDLIVSGDRNLLRIAVQNLLGNAWKFTACRTDATIAFGRTTNGHEPAFFVQDNGAGFDMQYADKLFGVFQRLHSDTAYPGTGVGLATVHRIIMRHGGKIWAEAEPGQGATFYFVL
jgi:PAS domain S-box-containing protein